MKKDFETLYEDLENKNELTMNETWNAAKKEKKRSNIVSFLIIFFIDIIWFRVFVLMLKKSPIMQSEDSFNDISEISIFLIRMAIFDLFAYIIVTAFFGKKCRKLSYLFKQKIVKEILNNFYDNVNYMPEVALNKAIYDNAKYKENYDRYYSEDCVEAKFDNKYNMKMAEVETVRDETDTRGSIDTITVFHGLFFAIELDKSIQNRLVINDNMKIFGEDKLEMDSQEFEKYFDVSSNNKIIGMQILTSDLMELLVDYKKENNMNFNVIIDNNLMYLRFNTGKMFELGSIKEGPLDKELIRKCFNILKFTYQLTGQLIKAIDDTAI